MRRPFVIGLTGSIGMGKSTVAQMFRDRAIPVFDADAEVHRLQGPGGALVGPIDAAFPGTVRDGAVDRAALAGAVMGDAAALRRLEAIVHPAVAAARADFLTRHTDVEMVVLDIPLLLEGNGQGTVDHILVVSAAPAIQRARVLARPGMSAARFDQILAHQLPDADKRARADSILDTGQAPERTAADLDRIIASVRAGLASRRGPANSCR